jgi:hypothetical protein
MKFRSARLGLAQSLVALSVSLAVLLSSHVFAFASLAKSPIKYTVKAPATRTLANQNQTDSPPSELRITSSIASASAEGVLVQWTTNAATDNLGFNVYRLKDGQRTRVNKEIIPGAIFAAAQNKLRVGYSYSWFDRGGTTDATYYIESINLQGTAKTYEALSPVTSKAVSSFPQAPEASNAEGAKAAESSDSFEKYYPAAEADISSPQGALEDQWAIAAQTGLKIGIKQDGWYRVTQAQMVAAGFNPTVDIRNLRLFGDAQEVAINTSQFSGAFGPSDYIEFYGRGLDLPTTDTRIYYLIAGTSPGKRVRGQIQLSGDPPAPPVPSPVPLPPAPTPGPPPPAPQELPKSDGPLLQDPIFFSWAQRDLSLLMASLRPAGEEQSARQEQSAGAVGRSRRNTAPQDVSVANADSVSNSNPIVAAGGSDESRLGVSPPGEDKNTADKGTDKNPVVTASTVEKTPSIPLSITTKRLAANPSSANNLKASSKSRRRSVSRKRTRRNLRREFKQERNHAMLSAAASPANYSYTSLRKDRGVYFVSLLNGDQENFFGQVITFNASNPATTTINSPNPDLNGAGTAQLEIALQGVNLVNHQISVEFNGVIRGSFSFFGFALPNGHAVQVFNIPASQLNNGANTIKFILPGGPDLSIVDYIKLTYPHQFRADTGALKFMLRGTQSVTVDGFATSSVRLIDYTDPFTVGISRPASAPSGSGFAISVPPSDPPSKPPRLLYAIPDGQFDQPASLSLNQPSTLNLNSNDADFLIVSHKNFMTSVEPLRLARQNQGMVAKKVDVEDIYDEFSFGMHGPQAIRDFLQHAKTNWATRPRYIIFAGDATLDPRNYQNIGNFDFVPTKLVDATFNETASDDWLTDFDNDGIADIPVGRLPVRTAVDADLEISKIINFLPANVPSSALLVADEDPNHIFGFVETNDVFQTLMPPTMTVQRVNRGLGNPPPTDAQVRADIIAAFNNGRSLVSYSGHGNVDVWTGASLFTSSDAFALTNGNKLSFVVVMDCLNGYYQDPSLLSVSEALLKAPGGGAVAAFASSGLTIAQGQHEMGRELYTRLFSGPPMALGDAIKLAKAATFDIDVKRTWIFFGDPSMKIR